MFLVDTDVISEARKGERADPGVRRFFASPAAGPSRLFLSSITIGELRRGVELLRHRRDSRQAERLDRWLQDLIGHYGDSILGFGVEEAQVWGYLRAPRPENALDKQIAAIALVNDLRLVTRNVAHFEGLGLKLVNPFSTRV